MLEFGVILTFFCVVAVIVKLFFLSALNNQSNTREPTTMVSIDELKELFKTTLRDKMISTNNIDLKSEYFSCYSDSASLLDKISKSQVVKLDARDSGLVDDEDVEEELNPKPKLKLV